jgi:hypothetical protein
LVINFSSSSPPTFCLLIELVTLKGEPIEVSHQPAT